MSSAGTDDALAAVMAVVADRGWRDVSLADLAAAVDLPTGQFYRLYPSKLALLEALMRQADLAVADQVDPSISAEPQRDRLFELVMIRLEALRPYKPAIARMVEDWRRDPLAAAAAALVLGRSLAFMLEAAGFSASGPGGRFRVNGLGALYAATLRVWLKDDSQDLAKTMAELDRRLAQIDAAMRRVESIGAAMRNLLRPESPSGGHSDSATMTIAAPE